MKHFGTEIPKKTEKGERIGGVDKNASGSCPKAGIGISDVKLRTLQCYLLA